MSFGILQTFFTLNNMTKIRQEINITNRVIDSTSDDNELVQLDTTQYNGATYYFECVGSASVTDSVTLRRSGTTTDDATVTFTGGAGVSLQRSSSFTPPAGQTVYMIHSTSIFANIKSARIIILQDATNITSTETQIEICGTGNSTTTSTTAVAISQPKYWKYTSANWDGVITVYFEATFKSGTSKSAATVSLQVADGTGDGFTGWADVTSSPITTTATVPTRVRSGAITLTAGRNYRAAFMCASSKSATTIYDAKIVLDQVGSQSTYYFDASQAGPTDAQSVWTNDANAFDGNTATAATTTTATSGDLNRLNGTGTTAPTTGDTIVSVQARLYGKQSAGGGSSYADIYYSGGSSLGAPFVNSTVDVWSAYVTLTVPSGGWDWSKVNSLEARVSSGVGTITSSTYRVEVLVTYGSVTKLESQYLLVNTLSGGTGLKTYLTKWDSTEWSGVTNVYSHAIDANNGETNVSEIDTAGGVQVTGSVVSSPDNQGISSAMTMPSDQDLDANYTSIPSQAPYGSRILVAVSVDAAAEEEITVTDVSSSLVDGGAAYSGGYQSY